VMKRAIRNSPINQDPALLEKSAASRGARYSTTDHCRSFLIFMLPSFLQPSRIVQGGGGREGGGGGGGGWPASAELTANFLRPFVKIFPDLTHHLKYQPQHDHVLCGRPAVMFPSAGTIPLVTPAGILPSQSGRAQDLTNIHASGLSQ